ncbi:MAG: hypothetical protein PVF10_07420, partial [Syntrophobacterales bacterium]
NGYRKEKDLLAYRVNADFELTRPMRALIKRAASRVKIRSLRKKRFREELDILQDIFEDAWSENWGFVPFTKAEFEHLGQNLKHLVHSEYVQIAEVEGTPDAMIVGIPNVNESIKDLDGRLLPLGWLKLIWRLKVDRPKTARVPLMGVRKRHHNSLLGAALAVMVIERVRRLGIKYGAKEVELSWILDENKGMRKILESIGGAVYKRYRIFAKGLVAH